MLAVEVNHRLVTRVSHVAYDFSCFLQQNLKFVYTKGNIQLSTSFKVCPQEIDNFYLKDIHVHMYMHFEKM